MFNPRTARSAASRTLLTAVAVAVAASACGDARRDAEQTFVPLTEGALTVATDLPAPGYWDLDDDGRPVGGFEYEIAAALAERFDLRLEVVDVAFDRIATGDLGGADLALAQITVTDDRYQQVAFSTPYFVSDTGVVARPDDEITDLGTARDRTWGAERGTTATDLVASVIRPDEVTLFDVPTACVEAVRDGAVEACLLDLPTALVLETQIDGVATVARFPTDEHWAVAVPAEGDDADHNRSVLDAGLRALDADGSLDRFAETWLDPLFARDPADVPVIEART